MSTEWVQVTSEYLAELYAEIARLRGELGDLELEVREQHQERRPQDVVQRREAA